MKLLLNKKDFVDNLLNPVSKLAENLLLDFQLEQLTGKWKAKTLVTSVDNSVVLMGEVLCVVEEPFRCIIPDCKTFLRLFAGIDSDDIEMHINSNSIVYKGNGFSFKYHLLDESYLVNKKSINEQKLKSLSFDTTFVLTKQKLSELIKFNSIVPDAEKIYFTTENGSVFAKIGDETRTNTNEIKTQLCTEYTGSALDDSFPLNMQNLLLFSFSSDDISCSINHSLKVFKFESFSLTYIVSGLVR